MVRVNDRIKTPTGKKGIVIRISRAQTYGTNIKVRFDDGSIQYYTPKQFTKIFKN